MALNTDRKDLKRVANRGALVCAAIFLLTLLPQGRATAQSAAGPQPAATPSDQPAQAPAARSNASAAKPNLAGTWKLNADQSDNPMEKMREAQQQSGEQPGGRRGGFGGGGGGFGGGGGNGGGGFGGGQNGNGRQGGGGRRGGMQAMAQLVIEQTPTSAKVTESSGRVIALYQANPESNGSQSASANPDADPPVAQWQDNKLVTTVQMPNGGTTTRSFEMSPDNKQLIVTTKIDIKRFKEPVNIRQVYDPVAVSTGGD